MNQWFLSCVSLLCACLFFSSCENLPKYKRGSGKVNEWKSYEGKYFKPLNGTVAATDLQANTVTISHGGDSTIFAISPQTRIMHDGADITLAQLPLNEEVKYTLSAEGTKLLTVWYGHTLGQQRLVNPEKQKKLY